MVGSFKCAVLGLLSSMLVGFVDPDVAVCWHLLGCKMCRLKAVLEMCLFAVWGLGSTTDSASVKLGSHNIFPSAGSRKYQPISQGSTIP